MLSGTREETWEWPVSGAQSQQDLSEIKGALDVIFTLREEFAQWVEEAQDEARKEELDNVYQHILVMEGDTDDGWRSPKRR